MASDKTKQLQEEVTLLKMIQQQADAYNIAAERTAQIQEKVAEKIERAKKAGKDYSDIQDEILGSMDEMLARIADMDKKEQKRVKTLKQQEDLQESIANSFEDMTSAMQLAASNDQKGLKAKMQQTDLMKAQIQSAVKSGAITKEQAGLYGLIIQQIQTEIKKAQEFQDVMGEDKLANIQSGFATVGNSIEKMTGGLIKSKDVQAKLFSMASKLGPQFMAALGPIGEIVSVVQKIYALMGELNAQTREFGSQTGLSFQQSEKLVQSSMRMVASGKNIMSNQKEILAAQGAVVQEFGNANAVSQDTVMSLSNMSKVLGVSEKDAAGVQQVLMDNAGASEDMALGLQQAGAALAEAYGVPIGEVMKDLAESGEEVAKYFSGMPDAAMKAAVELKAMGLNLKTASKMAEGLLDIEASLKAETKAQIMLGKAINLDDARRLAAQGDLVGAAKAATKEIGNAAEFAKMDQFQKKAAAEAAGLTVEELSKSYAMQERMEKLQGTMTKEQRDAIEKYGDKMGDITQMDDAALAAKVTALQEQEKMSAAMDNMKTAITTGLLPVMQLLSPIFQVIAGIIDYGITKPITFLVGLFEQMFNWVSKNLDVLGVFAATMLLIVGYQQRQLVQEGLIFAVQQAKLGLAYALNAATIVYNTLQGIATAIAAEGLLPYIARMAMAAFSSIASIPIVGPFIAPAAAAAALAYGYSLMTADDAMIPPVGEGGPGYSRVLSGPEGSIALNDKDSIIAGTDLAGGEGGAAPSGGGGGGMDIGPLVAAVQQTNALLSQMVKSPPPVLIGDEALRKIGRNVKVQNSRGA